MSLSTAKLNHLRALNHEIAALIRAGIPLDVGLLAFSQDVPGELGRLGQELALRLERGLTLEEAFEDSSLSAPPTYRAVVQAGLRTSHLAEAFEMSADTLGRLSEMRRLLVVSTTYPLIVLLVIWGFLLFFVKKIIPGFLLMEEELWPPLAWVYHALVRCGETAHIWGVAVPLVVMVAVSIWLWRSSRAGMLEAGGVDRLLGWVPLLGKTVRDCRRAAFTEVLALAVRAEVPLEEGVRLAAGATGDQGLIAGAEQMAGAIERGDATGDSLLSGRIGRTLPPIVRWLIGSNMADRRLLPSLERASAMYLRRATARVETARTFLPVLVTVIVAGGATLGYALLVYGSWLSIAWSLSQVAS